MFKNKFILYIAFSLILNYKTIYADNVTIIKDSKILKQNNTQILTKQDEKVGIVLKKIEDEYNKIEGTVLKVTKQIDLNRIIIKNNLDGTLIACNIRPGSILIKNDEIIYHVKEGDEVVISYKKDDVKSDITPIQINARSVIIGSSKESFTGSFNKNLMSSDGSVSLAIDQNTKVYDYKGRIVDFKPENDKTLLVLYKNATKSFPSKITADTIFLVENEEDKFIQSRENIKNVIDSISQDDIHIIYGIEYIKLSDIAQILDYNVYWNDDDKSIKIENDKNTFKVNVDKSEYDYNNFTSHFYNTPLIYEDKVYIELEFIKELVA